MYTAFCMHAASPTRTYTLSLHDALPISPCRLRRGYAGCDSGRDSFAADVGDAAAAAPLRARAVAAREHAVAPVGERRSEEHTSELQSQFHLVCRLLLAKKKDPMCQSTIC